jgi:hypothetical protein
MSETVTNNLYALVEQAWDLSTAASDYVKNNAGREVPLQEIFDKVFLPSGFVDVEKTQREGGNPPKVFLKSPYGLEFRPATKNWIPFRHGALPNLT